MTTPPPAAILALDLGSTNLKAALFDPQLNLLASAAQPVTYDFGAGGRVELPVAPLLAAAAAASRACLDQAPGVKLRAVAITSQAQTFTLADAAGQPLLPFVSWQDNRGDAAALARELGVEEFARHSSFAEILPALQVAQLRRLRDQQPDLLRSAHQILHLPTFLVQAMTGVTVIDDNLAAMSGLYSLELRDWWPAALAATGVRRTQLPRLIPIGEAVGRTTVAAAAFGLPPGIPVVLAGNDQTAGAVGAGLAQRGGLLLTLGTAQVAYAVTADLPGPAVGQIRGPFPGGQAYRMAADSCGGNLINWAQTVITGTADDAAFFALAATAPPGCHGLRFAAELPAGAGGWHHLGLHHGPADLARSILETLCQRLAAMVRRLGVDLPADGTVPVLAAGGGAASPLWRQLLAEQLGCPVTCTHGTPLHGAAALAVSHL